MEGDALVGSVIGPYRLDSVLGGGGMGVVYEAHHRHLKRRCALKIIKPVYARDEAFRRRFLREAEAAASIEHPHVVPIFDAGEVEGTLFIAMKYVNGTDLRTLLRSQGALELSRALVIVEQLADALDASHEQGLVHRDVKPANVMIEIDSTRGTGGSAFLTDFGIVRRNSPMARTTSAGFFGTLDYASPEQIEDRNLDGAADQYSLGCVLFECLTGAPPFKTDSDAALLLAHLTQSPPKLSEKDLPEQLDAVMERVLAKDPRNRFPSCLSFVETFKAAATGAPRSAAGPIGASDEYPSRGAIERPNQSLPPLTTRPRRSRLPPRPWLVPGLLVMLVLAAVAVFVGTSRTELPRSPKVGHPATVDSPSTSAPTVVPFNERIFHDRFSNDAGAWTVLDVGTYEVGYAPDGTFRLSVHRPKTTALSLNGELDTAQDIHIQGKITKLSGTDDNSFGFVCRARGPSDYYAITISSGGRFAFFKTMRGKAENLGGSGDLAPSSDLGNGRWTVGARCVGGGRGAPVELRLLVDHTLAGSVTDRSAVLSEGKVGLIATTGGRGGLELRFDDLEVLTDESSP